MPLFDVVQALVVVGFEYLRDACRKCGAHARFAPYLSYAPARGWPTRCITVGGGDSPTRTRPVLRTVAMPDSPLSGAEQGGPTSDISNDSAQSPSVAGMSP